jgi:ribosomal protein S18 acetylase RimI-like enzyme
VTEAGDTQVLAELEVYYDAVPRSAARWEQIGPFTLFTKIGAGWPYYARPTLGTNAFSADDVLRVRARQRELGVAEAFEWVAETTPALQPAAEAGGLAVTRHPLMVLGELTVASPGISCGVEVRLVTSEDDLALLNAIGHVAFGAPGTAAGPQGVENARAAADRNPAALSLQSDRLRDTKTVMAVALVDGQPVGIGSHNPVGLVSEVVGVAVLPAFRRRGIASALTRRLVADALQRSVNTVFLSADDATVARIYRRVGFREVGTACVAEPAPPTEHINQASAGEA